MRSSLPVFLLIQVLGTDENGLVLLTTIRKKFTRLEATVRMKTTVSTAVGTDHCQDEDYCQDGDNCQYCCCQDGNRCQDRDPCQDGDGHADDQNQRTSLKYN